MNKTLNNDDGGGGGGCWRQVCISAFRTITNANDRDTAAYACAPLGRPESQWPDCTAKHLDSQHGMEIIKIVELRAFKILKAARNFLTYNYIFSTRRQPFW